MGSNLSEASCYLIMRRYFVAEKYQSRFRLLMHEKEIKCFLYRKLANIARIFIDDKSMVLLYLDNGFAPQELSYDVWKGLNYILHGKKATDSTTYLFAEYHVFQEDMESRDRLAEYRSSNDSWVLLE